ncbi:MAG TPA: LPS export ABC transporter permease LptF [Gammaproteobacteria bacterium]|nr:LPS export ABC transporter permease LptF [Gammaproteobacteria bacterium]
MLTLAAVAGVLYVIYVSNRFIRFLASASAEGLPAGTLLQFLGLKSLSNLVMLLPLALFFAVLLALGRFYKDNEMTALAACGIGPGRVLRIVLGFALLPALLVGGISLRFGPWAEELTYRIQDEARASAEIQGISAGRFQSLRDGKLVFYVEAMNDERTELSHVFVETRREGVLNVLTAVRGRQWVNPEDGSRYLILEDGYRYEGEPGQARYKIVRFGQHGVLLEQRTVVPGARKLAALPTGALWQRADAAAWAELHWRLAMPLSTLLLAALAVPLSRTHPRQGRFGRLFAAVLAYAVYTNALAVGRTWIEQGAVPVALGLWWAHGALLLWVGVWMARQSGWRPFVRRGASP